MMNSILKPTLLVVVGAFIIWIFYRWRKQKIPGKSDWRNELTGGLLLSYIAGLISVTLMPYPHFIHAHLPVRVNLIPLVDNVRELKLALNDPSGFSLVNSLENLVGNVLLFIPFGILIPLYSPKFRKFSSIVLLAFFTSIAIELIQWLLSIFKVYRSIDIDDVILDTVGAAIGYGLFFLFVKKANNI